MPTFLRVMDCISLLACEGQHEVPFSSTRECEMKEREAKVMREGRRKENWCVREAEGALVPMLFVRDAKEEFIDCCSMLCTKEA